MEESHFFDKEALDVADLDNICVKRVQFTHNKVNFFVIEGFKLLVLVFNYILEVLVNSLAGAESEH